MRGNPCVNFSEKTEKIHDLKNLLIFLNSFKTYFRLYKFILYSKVNDFDSINNIADKYTLDKDSQKISNNQCSIDPAYDIPITQMCNYLYNKHPTK